MFSSTTSNLGQASDRADSPFQVSTSTDSVSSAGAGTYTEAVEGHERGIVQRARGVDQRIRTKDV